MNVIVCDTMNLVKRSARSVRLLSLASELGAKVNFEKPQFVRVYHRLLYGLRANLLGFIPERSHIKPTVYASFPLSDND